MYITDIKARHNIVKKQLLVSFPLILFIFFSGFAQAPVEALTDKEITPLFASSETLPVRLRYSIKELRKETNDSTYLENSIAFQNPDGTWDSIPARIRARGNWRLKNCYFPPVKIKIKKKTAAGTLFEGNKELKLVLPCLLQKSGDDKVLCELLAYRIYENVSPYHFKSRRLAVELYEEKGKKVKVHQLEGFVIEDIKNVAKRFDGHVNKRKVHPLQQDNMTCLQNDFFQYMIGNTDYSVAYQHNEKLLFVNKSTLPVPYDFDMSGLVDASYAVVSQIGDQKLAIDDVKQRLYRGFKRDPALYEQVRQQYLSNKADIMALVDELESSFKIPAEFKRTRAYISAFFDVLQNEQTFRKEVLSRARVK